MLAMWCNGTIILPRAAALKYSLNVRPELCVVTGFSTFLLILFTLCTWIRRQSNRPAGYQSLVLNISPW